MGGSSLATERAPGSFPENGAPLGGLEFDKQRLQVPTYLQLGRLRAGSLQPMTVPHSPAEPAELSCSNNVRGAPLPNLGLKFLSSSPTLFTQKVTSVWPAHLNLAVTEKDELDTLCARDLLPGQEELGSKDNLHPTVAVLQAVLTPLWQGFGQCSPTAQ